GNFLRTINPAKTYPYRKNEPSILKVSGYLLQIFTKPIVDRPTVFIEVIQRKGVFERLSHYKM
ncbi:hypothetical protein P6709_20385, partial [Jeotgalibacillus sp. ET6]|uniref:hypothetical protein n=1 Tax=Jeotgalibacillus sp. ET6 TaxID=3037260 RepID=UPI0024182A76